MSEKGSESVPTTVVPGLLKHLEYDIEVLEGDDASLLSASKLVINLEHKQNRLEFMKHKKILSTIPISDIEQLSTISDIRGRFGKQKDSVIGIRLYASPALQNKKFITFDVKNKKYVHLIHQQMELLKDAETNKSSHRAIKTTLNPEVCHTCLENNFSFEFNSKGKLCYNCFVKEFGQILLQTPRGETTEYIGGHSDYVLTGMFGKRAIEGIMYLTQKYIIFANDEKDLSKKWEIIIPLESIILNWELEEEMRQKYLKWDATPLDSFGFGSSFIRPNKGSDSQISDRLLVSYIDKNNQTQKPEFSISIISIQKSAANLYKMAIKAKMASSQQNILRDNYGNIIQTSTNCLNCNRKFDIYNIGICGHCITPFCHTCRSNHSIKREIEFDTKYLGGHKRYALQDSFDTRLYIFSDRIEILDTAFRIFYTQINNIGNADESKLSALRVAGLGLVGALWKKKHVYTIIQYTDGFNEEQTLVLDFGWRLFEAQRMIYDRMLASRRTKNNLLKTTEDKPAKNTEISNPLHILKLRLAKGEITKEEYEEMRKVIES